VVASGVLYHINEPIRLLQSIGRVTSQVGSWIHYYRTDIIRARPELDQKFKATLDRQKFRNIEIRLARQAYLDALDWAGFSGGSAMMSYWLTRRPFA